VEGAAAAVGQVRLEVEGWHGMQRPLPGARVLAATRLVASSTGGERPPRRRRHDRGEPPLGGTPARQPAGRAPAAGRGEPRPPARLRSRRCPPCGGRRAARASRSPGVAPWTRRPGASAALPIESKVAEVEPLHGWNL